MPALVRATVVALSLTGYLAPATSTATTRPHDSGTPVRICERTFTRSMFLRAARSTYRGTGTPPRGSYHALWAYARCARPPGSERSFRRLWGAERSLWAARRAALRARTPYDGWAIPEPIVMCESRGQNLPPNYDGASGAYQILGSTWAAYGGTAPYEAYLHSRSEQDAVAARIWREGGPSQWSCASMVSWR